MLTNKQTHVERLASKRSTCVDDFVTRTMLTVRLHDSSRWYYLMLHGPEGSDRQKSSVSKISNRYIQVYYWHLNAVKYISANLGETSD